MGVPARLPCHPDDMLWPAAALVRISRRRPMKKKRVFRCLSAVLIGLAAVCLGGGAGLAEDAKAPLAVQLTFDRPLESSMAPFNTARKTRRGRARTGPPRDGR